MVQSEEGEPTLFMVSTSVLSVIPNSDSKSTEAIDNGVAPLSVIGEGSTDSKEELQLCVAKTPAGKLIQLKKEPVFA